MRPLRIAVLAASLVASTAYASPAAPVNGAEYITLASPVPVSFQGKKVEVIEFFMYHCQHCNELEPLLAEWIKKQGDDIVMKRVPFPYYGPNDPEAHLYLTLEAIGKLDELHRKVFNAVLQEHVRLNTDDAVLAWVTKAGVDKAKFLEYWNSFGMLAKMKRLNQIVASYKVDSAPALVVDGRYMTSPSVVEASNKGLPAAKLSATTIQVLDGLVAKVQKEKGRTNK